MSSQQLHIVIVLPFTWLHAIGTSKEACTFQVISWWSSLVGTFVSPPHKDGIFTCLTHHSISNLRHASRRVPDVWALTVVGVMLMLSRYIKESIFIRVNNPTLNNNVGKFNLLHIWDRVLINTPGLNLNK